MRSDRLYLVLALMFVAGCGGDDDSAGKQEAPDSGRHADAGPKKVEMSADAGRDAAQDAAQDMAACPGTSHFPVNPDAPPEVDLSCLGNVETETTSCTHLTFKGNLHKFLDSTPLHNVTMEILDRDRMSLGKVSSEKGDDVSVVVPVGKAGFLGSVLLTADGVWPHEVFELERPVTSDPSFIDGLTLDDMLSSSLAMLAMIDPTDASKNGGVIVRVLDCNGRNVEGATVVLNVPNGGLVYLRASGLPDPNLTATTSFGAAAFSNVAPGPVEATVRRADPDADGGEGEGEIIAVGKGVMRAGVLMELAAHPK